MQAKIWVVSLLLGGLVLGLASGTVAETIKNRIDLTGRQDVSEDEIISALTPIKTRGIKTIVNPE